MMMMAVEHIRYGALRTGEGITGELDERQLQLRHSSQRVTEEDSDIAVQHLMPKRSDATSGSQHPVVRGHSSQGRDWGVRHALRLLTSGSAGEWRTAGGIDWRWKRWRRQTIFQAFSGSG